MTVPRAALADAHSKVRAFRMRGGHRLSPSDPVGCASIVLAVLNDYEANTPQS